MTIFKANALNRLLEPGASSASMKSVDMPITNSRANSKTKRMHNSKLERVNNSLSGATSNTRPMNKKFHRSQISPALYATPDATPLPDSPSSFTPSPCIINHKQRGPRLLKSFSRDDVPAQTHQKQSLDEERGAFDSTKSVPVNFVAPSLVEEEPVDVLHDEEVGSSGVGKSAAEAEVSVRFFNVSSERNGESSVFYEPQESISYASYTDGESNGGPEHSVNFTTPTAEFFDAWEELSSESGPHSSLYDVEAELREMRLSSLMEIEKRKQAEEALNNMQSQWQKIVQRLSLGGLAFPADPSLLAEHDRLDADPVEELCQKIYLAQSVSESIGRGTAKAEAEMEMEAQTESKNFEITRFWDQLQYYEVMNQEMSQRNQETVEIARCRRKRRQKWAWGLTAGAIMLGATAFVISYLSTGIESSSSYQSQAPEKNDAAQR